MKEPKLRSFLRHAWTGFEAVQSVLLIVGMVVGVAALIVLFVRHIFGY